MVDLSSLTRGIPFEKLGNPITLEHSVPHAPARNKNLTPSEFSLAIKNALRYFPPEYHPKLAIQFANELRVSGHI